MTKGHQPKSGTYGAAFWYPLEHHGATAGVGKYHTDDDENSEHNPDPLNGFFGALIKKKTHGEYGLSLKWYNHSTKRMQFGKDRAMARLWYSWPVIIGLTLLAVLLSVSVYERFKVEREMAGRASALEAERAALEAREAELTDRVLYLRGERGVEEEIRKNFDVARKGEQVVILTGEPVPPPPPDTPPPAPPTPWYIFWR